MTKIEVREDRLGITPNVEEKEKQKLNGDTNSQQASKAKLEGSLANKKEKVLNMMEAAGAQDSAKDETFSPLRILKSQQQSAQEIFLSQE